jgi:hypothetical protein
MMNVSIRGVTMKLDFAALGVRTATKDNSVMKVCSNFIYYISRIKNEFPKLIVNT